MKQKVTCAFFIMICFLFAQFLWADSLPQTFDPKRNPDKDLETAVQMAKESNRRILIDVGVKSCDWCEILEKWIEDNPDVDQFISDNYVILKIHPEKVLTMKNLSSEFSKSIGIPHFFVLSAEGKFLFSQGTAPLEEGKSYNKQKVMDFLKKWAPNPEQSES